MTTPEAVTLVLAALSLGLSAFLHLETSRKQKEQQARWTRRQQSLESEIGKQRGLVAELRARVGDNEHESEIHGPVRTVQDSLNLNRRTQAIRLFRRGEHPEKVAQLLSLPHQETILLYKVFRTIRQTDELGGPSSSQEICQAAGT